MFYSNNGGTTFSYQGIQPGDSTSYSFVIPMGVTDEAQIKLVAIDNFENEGEGVSNLFSVTDNTPPEVAISTPGIAETGEVTSVNWEASDNTGFRSHHLYLSVDSGQTFVVSDSASGTSSNFPWNVPDSIVSDVCLLKIVSYDLVNLTAIDTSDLFSIIDAIPPPPPPA